MTTISGMMTKTMIGMTTGIINKRPEHQSIDLTKTFMQGVSTERHPVLLPVCQRSDHAIIVFDVEAVYGVIWKILNFYFSTNTNSFIK